METELIAKANAALEKRARAFEERKAVTADATLTDADKRKRVEAIDADMEALKLEARGYVTEAEVRSAIAGSPGVPSGKPEVRAGDRLAAELRAIRERAASARHSPRPTTLRSRLTSWPRLRSCSARVFRSSVPATTRLPSLTC